MFSENTFMCLVLCIYSFTESKRNLKHLINTNLVLSKYLLSIIAFTDFSNLDKH